MATIANYKVISTDALVALFKQALEDKWGYIWGTAGEKWTEAKQASLEKTTSSDKEMGRKYGKKWIGHYVADCSGLFSWAFKKLGGYMYHGSDTMRRKYCTNAGDLVNGMRTDGQALKPGTAVFTYNKKKNNYGHVGLYIGDGWVIEAMGTINGVCRTKITASKWVSWGELKGVDYSGAASTPIEPEKPEAPAKPDAKTYPTLRRGARGENVRTLQELLAKDGSKLAIDGIFGPGTQSAVRAFQKKYGLKVDGIVGPQTWKKLRELYC